MIMNVYKVFVTFALIHCILILHIWFFYLQVHLCPKNLTFPKAERDQLCPRLVIVVFCLFFTICQLDLLFAGMNQSNSFLFCKMSHIHRCQYLKSVYAVPISKHWFLKQNQLLNFQINQSILQMHTSTISGWVTLLEETCMYILPVNKSNCGHCEICCDQWTPNLH